MTYTQPATTKTVIVAASLLLYTGVAGSGQQQPQQLTGTEVLEFSPTSSPECVVDSTSKRWVKFQYLVKEWRRQRGVMSSITEMSTLPAYQKIIGMGEAVIPLILAQLKAEGDDPDHWFWALASITEANPVKPEDRGNTVKMAEAWLKWAEDEDHAW
ncbi:MAG TPA: hypothetical protein VI636_21495 [Candidatus Angelobacter sp.]